MRAILLSVLVLTGFQQSVLACNRLWNDVCFTYVTSDDSYLADNCDFVAKDLGSARGRADQCGSICRSSSGCEVWSWNDHQGGTCYLKTKKPFDLVKKQGVKCGMRRTPHT